MPSLLEPFGHMVFTRRFRLEPEGCEVEWPLRLHGAAQIVPRPITEAAGEDRQRFIDTLLASVEHAGPFVRGSTGLDLDVSLDRNTGADHHVFLVLRDEATLDAAVEAGTAEAIGQDVPVTEPFVEARTQGLASFTRPFHDETGQVADVVVAVLANRPPDDLATCSKGGMLDAAGPLRTPIASTSLWDDGCGCMDAPDLVGEGHSACDRALLRLLHHPEIPRGAPHLGRLAAHPRAARARLTITSARAAPHLFDRRGVRVTLALQRGPLPSARPGHGRPR